MTKEKYLTARQASIICGVHYNTLLEWIKKGKLPAEKFTKSYFIRELDIPTYLRHDTP